MTSDVMLDITDACSLNICCKSHHLFVYTRCQSARHSASRLGMVTFCALTIHSGRHKAPTKSLKSSFLNLNFCLNRVLSLEQGAADTINIQQSKPGTMLEQLVLPVVPYFIPNVFQ